jgi:hypothetical protein
MCIVNRHDLETGLPVEVALVDFQLVHQNRPGIDLVYFFLTSTDPDLRDLFSHYLVCNLPLDILYFTIMGSSMQIYSYSIGFEKVYLRELTKFLE